MENKYNEALNDWLNNEGTPIELAEKYNLDIDILRTMIYYEQEKIKHKE
jgi:uncharacterized protein (DUF433 family)